MKTLFCPSYRNLNSRRSSFTLPRSLRSNRGTSLVEVLMAAGISLIVFSSILSTLLGISAMTAVARHYTQAMHVVRGQAEELKGTAFDQIINTNAQASYDAGTDAVFGTADDLRGTLSVTIIDTLDMDNDNNRVETSIDVDGDGVNDCFDFPACTDPYAKPAHITFTWNERLWSLNKNMSVTLDTLIAQ